MTTLIKLFYQKIWKTGSRNRTVEFDPVYGDQTNLQRFKYGVMENDHLLVGVDAYLKMLKPIWGGKTFAEYIPDYPALPSRYLPLNTIWRKFPEVMPEPSDVNYKCRKKVSQYGNQIFIIECRTQEDIQKFYDFGVEEWCYVTDEEFYTREHNPKYDLVKAERVNAINTWYLNLQAEYEKPNGNKLKLVLMGLAEFPVIPDTEGYHWYIVNEDGSKTEIPVEKGKYSERFKFVPVWDTTKYNRWLGTAKSTIAKPKDDIMKILLGIK